MKRTTDPAAELLTLAGNYLLALKAVIALTETHPEQPVLSQEKRLEEIREIATAALECRKPCLSEATLAYMAQRHEGGSVNHLKAKHVDTQHACEEISGLDQQLLHLWKAEESIARWQPTPQERLSHKQTHYQAAVQRFEETAAAVLPQHRDPKMVLLTATYLVKAAAVIGPDTLQQALDLIGTYEIRTDLIIQATIARLRSVLARGLVDEEEEKRVIWKVMHG